MLLNKIQLKNLDFGCMDSEYFNLYWQLEQYSVAAFFFLGVSTPVALFLWLFSNLNEDIRIIDIQEREKRLIDYEKYVLNKAEPKKEEVKPRESISIGPSAAEQSGSQTNRRSKEKGDLPMNYFRKKTIRNDYSESSRNDSRHRREEDSFYTEEIVIEEDEESEDETEINDYDLENLNMKNKIQSEIKIVKGKLL